MSSIISNVPNITSAEDLDAVPTIDLVAAMVSLSLRDKPIPMDFGGALGRREVTHSEVVAAKALVEKVFAGLDEIDSRDWGDVEEGLPSFTIDGFKFVPNPNDEAQMSTAASIWISSMLEEMGFEEDDNDGVPF